MADLFRLFDNLNIKKKILMGFTTLILLSIILGVFTFWQFTIIQTNESELEVANRITTNVLEARRYEKNYVIYRTDEHASSCLSFVELIKEDAAILSAGTGIRANVDAYIVAFNLVISNWESEEIIVEELRVIGRTLTNETEAAYLSGNVTLSILETVYDVRRSEKNYMLFKTDSDKTETLSYISDIKAAFSSLSSTCNSYTTKFNELVAIYADEAINIATMRTEGRAIQASSDEAAVTALNASRQAMTDAIVFSVVLILTIAIGGILFALFLANRISDPIAKIATSLASSSQELAASAEEINAGSEEISSSAQQISKGTQDQAERVGGLMTNINELSMTFSAKIKELEGTSDLIQDITSQINMLSLNASIEAARAGEYGRGFAVVADNIRRLADDSKDSLEAITTAINDIRKNVETSMEDVNETVQFIGGLTEETASGAEEASAASEEQAATMQEMSATAQELAQFGVDMEKMVK